MNARVCELCSKEASLYCASDSAFLCLDCDTRVHQANFLVARHVRQSICSKCNDLAGNSVTGGGVVLRYIRLLCRACSTGDFSGEADSTCISSSSSESSACISSAESVVCTAKKIGFDGRRKTERITSSSSVTDISGEDSNVQLGFSGEVTLAKVTDEKKKKSSKTTRLSTPICVDAKAEGIFVNWCTNMGLNSNSAILPLVSQALNFCLGRSRALPSKVLLATSFWLGMKFYGNRSMCTFKNLKRLEEISGVPAKMILTVGLKIARELTARRGRREVEEGWAECSA
ncbi:hypothetical protein FNV43_RR27279 [Rhamnella rubrinervis]|uniref:B box-type domain-containing protein n=1 Tax=Rhamnella rubrinervis TaxID=2594499 RepID=A0A8K0DQR2_9ROSA|nr:hypothetical protein FNV43_RR27279 [Rhamnella rubrinervis]